MDETYHVFRILPHHQVTPRTKEEFSFQLEWVATFCCINRAENFCRLHEDGDGRKLMFYLPSTELEKAGAISAAYKMVVANQGLVADPVQELAQGITRAASDVR